MAGELSSNHNTQRLPRTHSRSPMKLLPLAYDITFYDSHMDQSSQNATLILTQYSQQHSESSINNSARTFAICYVLHWLVKQHQAV